METQDGITEITAEDLPRVVEVWEASVRATHHFLTEADIEYLTSLVEDDIGQVQTLLGIRAGDGQVVGFIGVEGDEVAALFIHPDWRGRGIGRRLFTYAVETLGATSVDVNEQNDQAVGFYRRMGCEVVGRSALDGLGQPFPLLHMRLSQAEQASPEASYARGRVPQKRAIVFKENEP
jgi:putative acetyltransferase